MNACAFLRYPKHLEMNSFQLIFFPSHSPAPRRSPHFLTRINASTALRGAQNLPSHLVSSSLLWILPISTCAPFTSISCKAFLQHISGSCPFSIPLETMSRIILHHIWRGSTASRLVSPPSGFLHL